MFAISRRLNRLSTLVIAAFSLTLAGAQAPAPMRAAYRVGKPLVINGSSFDLVPGNKEIFRGTSAPASGEWVSIKDSLRGVSIPFDAGSGSIQILVNGVAVGTSTVATANRPSEVANALTAFFNGLNTSFLDYLIALAALGTLTMSIIQTLKTVFQMRMLFQRWSIRRWLDEHRCLARGQGLDVPLPVVEWRIISLGANGDYSAFYGAETEDMFRQLSAVAQIAIDYPSCYKELVGVIAARSAKEDFDVLIGRTTSLPTQTVQDIMRRVREQSNQDIAGLHISLMAKWKTMMQIMSFLISLVLAYSALLLARGGVQSPFGLGITALLAAFLSPIARDLVAALEKIRS